MPNVVYVLMMSYGDCDYQVNKPVRVFSNKQTAESFLKVCERDAAAFEGACNSFHALIEDWDNTHPIPDEVGSYENDPYYKARAAYWEKLDDLLLSSYKKKGLDFAYADSITYRIEETKTEWPLPELNR